MTTRSKAAVLAPSDWTFRENSLDAIRLFAASQVAIEHAYAIMDPPWKPEALLDLLSYFPGVPIFFFISGYLISRSFERAPSVQEYARNRLLRIYPALIVCVVLNVLMVASTDYLASVGAGTGDVLLLALAKASFVQFYNPDFMRAFGDGVLNGSLWTICVELQLYVAYPLLCRLFGRGRSVGDHVLLAAFVLSLLCNQVLVWTEAEAGESVYWKLVGVSVLPWFYMFVAGVLFQRHFEQLSALFSRVPALAFMAGYLVLTWALVEYGAPLGNYLSPAVFVLVVLTVFRLAYAGVQPTKRVLRGNDISYGLYIWHMPIINQMIYLGHAKELWAPVLALALSYGVAFLSWRFIERPALRIKHFSLRRSPSPGA